MSEKNSQNLQDDYKQVKKLFASAIELDGEKRAAFLDENCAAGKIRNEIESLLAAHIEAENFLNNVSAVEIVQNSIKENRPVDRAEN